MTLGLPAHLEDNISPEPNSGCWLWLGALTEKGYGQVRVILAPERSTTRRAHRLVYEHLVGPIPEGDVGDHWCEVKCCVNPEHVKPTTHRGNLLRGNTLAARNAAKTRCVRGHSLANALVTVSGSRRCRACNKLYGLHYQLKKGR